MKDVNEIRRSEVQFQKVTRQGNRGSEATSTQANGQSQKAEEAVAVDPNLIKIAASMAEPATDPEKISRIKAQVQEGYRVDSASLAKSVIMDLGL